MPAFAGVKISCSSSVGKEFADVACVPLLAAHHDRIVTRPGFIGDGRNSGFQAINLAVQFGAARIVLTGFDMWLDRGIHWHGPHGRALNNPGAAQLAKWRRIVDAAAGDLAALGIDVINATPGSALTAYRFASLEEALS